jgi:hypothetical protein
MAATDVSMEDFEELEGLIRAAVAKAEEIAHYAGGGLQATMEAYTIPHLQTWADDEHQIGSVPCLMDTWAGYDEEDEYEMKEGGMWESSKE